ncbi:MAG TPA: flagellar basal body L-ring protein FlgH [Candidatus Sulfotelmatobacter sp.]|nr:flagellar basal body L-ring protein FlgH [Candidatus Sulfotelmatobacter sp.]
MRILIAEDDEALAKFVQQGLEGENHSVQVFPDGEQAKQAAVDYEYDVVVLDLNLPRLDGISVLRHVRLKKPSLPILVLTQRTRVEDRVQCLDTGADDYLGKPFSFTELSARIRALVRRSHLPSESVLQIADLKLDRVGHQVERAGRRIELTAKEFSLLEYLMRNAAHRVTRSMIIEHVWNLSFDTTTNVVDVYINYKASRVGDLVTISVAQNLSATSTGNVSSNRSFSANSGISALPGQLKTTGVANLFSPSSSQALTGKAQATSQTSLSTTLTGRVAAVLPSGTLVIEAERQITMNNQHETVILRGLVRPGDLDATNTVPSNHVGDLEVEVKGKGVVSEGTRPPNPITKWILRLVGF